jgi:hypothetical protein
MKGKDVKVGVLYAYATSPRDTPQPVVIADKRYGWAAGSLRWGANKTEAKRYPNYDRAEDKNGMLGVVARRDFSADTVGPLGNRYVPAATPEKVLSAARGVTTYLDGTGDSIALKAGKDSTVRFFAADPRFILGEYDQVMEEREIAAQAKAQREAEEKTRREAEKAARRERIDALLALGLPEDPMGFGSGKRSIVLSVDQVDILLSLIPEGAKYEPPVDDSWEYAEPEGQKGATVHVVSDEQRAEEKPKPKPRRTTGKSVVFRGGQNYYVPKATYEFFGIDRSRSQPVGNFIAVAPTKAAVEEMLIERGWKPSYAESIAEGLKQVRLTDLSTYEEEMAEAGLIAEDVKDIYVFSGTGADRPIARLTGEETFEHVATFRVEKGHRRYNHKTHEFEGKPDRKYVEVAKPTRRKG